MGMTKISATEAGGKANSAFDKSNAELCDKASREVARITNVPVDLLFAVSRTETGRTSYGNTEPWPWTVNMEGRGIWFATQAEALTYVYDHFKTGARSFDVGCFQINYRWHGAMFNSIEEMFDPTENAKYAALFLEKLFNESGDWRVAVGTFHSRTPELADRYLKKFDRILDTRNLVSHQSNRENRKVNQLNQKNRFPLLQSGQTSGLASLVPLPEAESNTAGLFQEHGLRR